MELLEHFFVNSVILQILIQTHIYSWEINKNGLPLLADENIINNSITLTTKNINDESAKYLKKEINKKKIDKIQEAEKMQRGNYYGNLPRNVQPIANIIPPKDFSRIVNKLENLLKFIVLPTLYGPLKYTDGNEQFQNSHEGNNVKKETSIIGLDNIKKLGASNKFETYHGTTSVESKYVLNNTPYLAPLNSRNQTSTLPDSPSSYLINNFANDEQVTLTPVKFHTFWKNFHLINKRHTFQSDMQYSDSLMIPNGNLPMTNTNLKSTLPRYLKYDFHLPHRKRSQHNKQYIRTSEDENDGKCIAGSSWVSDGRQCTCNEAREQSCVKMPTGALRQIISCKPLTYFTLNLCTKCYCDVNAIPKCNSKCSHTQILQNALRSRSL
ncbi:hypothetical protein evm_005668 [Chilo suppressalis]|nr:hypothetical protein evm_005668 [Chilo suppressalis]